MDVVMSVSWRSCRRSWVPADMAFTFADHRVTVVGAGRNHRCALAGQRLYLLSWKWHSCRGSSGDQLATYAETRWPLARRSRGVRTAAHAAGGSDVAFREDHVHLRRQPGH